MYWTFPWLRCWEPDPKLLFHLVKPLMNVLRKLGKSTHKEILIVHLQMTNMLLSDSISSCAFLTEFLSVFILCWMFYNISYQSHHLPVFVYFLMEMRCNTGFLYLPWLLLIYSWSFNLSDLKIMFRICNNTKKICYIWNLL